MTVYLDSRCFGKLGNIDRKLKAQSPKWGVGRRSGSTKICLATGDFDAFAAGARGDKKKALIARKIISAPPQLDGARTNVHTQIGCDD